MLSFIYFSFSCRMTYGVYVYFFYKVCDHDICYAVASDVLVLGISPTSFRDFWFGYKNFEFEILMQEVKLTTQLERKCDPSSNIWGEYSFHRTRDTGIPFAFSYIW